LAACGCWPYAVHRIPEFRARRSTTGQQAAHHFVRGEALGDVVDDFTGNGDAAGDRIVFMGFGTAAAVASFTIVSNCSWQSASADGLTTEMITVFGAVVAQR